MKRLIVLALLFVGLSGVASAQAALPAGAYTESKHDSVGSVLRRYAGFSALAPSYVVPGSLVSNIPGGILTISNNTGAPDTVYIEQQVIHYGSKIAQPNTLVPGDTTWEPLGFLDMSTGVLDNSGMILISGRVAKVQVYDLSKTIKYRLRTATLRPSAHRVTYSIN